MLPTEIFKVLCWRDKMEVMNVGIIKYTQYPVNWITKNYYFCTNYKYPMMTYLTDKLTFEHNCYTRLTFHWFYLFIYLFGVLHRFQHCTGHITTGSWKGRGNQYIQFVRVLYCKLPTNGKQLPAFPLEPVRGSNPGLRGGRRECYHSATVAPTFHWYESDRCVYDCNYFIYNLYQMLEVLSGLVVSKFGI